MASALQPPHRRRATADERRAQLLETALRCFAERGYDATTTRDIAEAAGVAEGLVFRHFPSKRALLEAILHHYNPRERLHLELEPRLARLPVRDALRTICQVTMETLWEHRLLVRLVVNECTKSSEAVAEMHAILDSGPRLIDRFFRERIARGELRPFDVEAAVAILRGALFAVFIRHLHSGPDEGRQRCRELALQCADLMLTGMLPREGQSASEPERLRANDDDQPCRHE